jgi:hypothetical protein
MAIFTFCRTRLRSMPHAFWLAIAPVSLVPFLLLGCGTSTTPQSSTTPTLQTNKTVMDVNIVATDFAFNMPDTVSAGLVRFTFVNQGKELHHAQLFKLNDGATQDQFLAALKQGGPAAVRTYSAPFGGPNLTSPGQTSEVVNLLQPATYMVVCLVHPKGEDAHFNEGMVKQLKVTGSPQNMPDFAIKDTGEIQMMEMQFIISANFPKGTNTFHVRNIGAQPHAIQLLKLAPGKTVYDARPYLGLDDLETKSLDALPFKIAGGFGAVVPGQQGYLMINLDPGNYLLVCPVVDAKTGKQHYMEGMYTPFTVS